MKLAFYAFGNFRMTGIHAGIQMGHAACELFTTHNKKRFNDTQNCLAQEWVDTHKTFIFLHAGQSCDLLAGYNEFNEKFAGLYPVVLFREEGGAFGDTPDALGAVTAWGVVLPESVFAAEKKYDDDIDGEKIFFRSAVEDGMGGVRYFNWNEGDPQFDLLKHKARFGLAR